MSAPAPVEVVVNGRAVRVPAGTRLGDYLASQGVDPRRIAVERNREVVRRGEAAALPMQQGDVFEVVHFVGGG